MKITYTITPLDADSKPIAFFPGWNQPFHPFHDPQVKGIARYGRVSVIPDELFMSDEGRRARREGLKQLDKIAEQGFALPQLRLPASCAYVSIKVNGLRPDGHVWGKWAISRLPIEEREVSLPEDWRPAPLLVEWLEQNWPGVNRERVIAAVQGYVLQPWRLGFGWPHGAWSEWYRVEGATELRPGALYVYWLEERPLPDGSPECDLLTMGLMSQWLAGRDDRDLLPDGLTVHICSLSEYRVAELASSQHIGIGRMPQATPARKLAKRRA